MAANALPSSGALLSATDFFGKTDVEGLEKFKTIAFRALHEQKIEEELQQTKQENEELKEENARVLRDLKELQASFDANIDDRERVLAFKSKRIEELLGKLRECETINASFFQAMNGKNFEEEAHVGSSQRNSMTLNQNGVEPLRSETETRARMMTLINGGKPLFHALDTCKEQEYKQLHEASQRHCDQLMQTALENEADLRETRLARFNKRDSEMQIEQLQAQLAAVTLEKSELSHHAERKLLLEHDRLHREKESELKALQETMRTQMRMQLDMTTQRTVEENERVQLELRHQSSHLEKMMKRIDTLEAENKRLRQGMHLVEEMNAGLSKKVTFYEHLVAKRQRKEEQRSRQIDNSQQQSAPSPPSLRRTPRKPPLPALSSGKYTNATSPEVPSLDSMGSPHDSCFPPDVESFEPIRTSDSPSPYQLNAITDVLEKHLQSREFTKKQVVAVLKYHHDQYRRRDSPKVVRDVVRLGTAPVSKKRLMLSNKCYLPTSHGRRIRDPPMTLDSLIRQKLSSASNNAQSNNSSDLAIDEKQRQLLHQLLLPDLSRKERNDKPRSSMGRDASEMWKRSGSRFQDERDGFALPATARF